MITYQRQHIVLRSFVSSVFLFGLLALLLATSTVSAGTTGPSTSKASTDLTSDPFTMSTTWEWHDASESDPVLLLGLQGPNSTEQPVFAIMGVKDSSGWFPTWRLQLRTTAQISGKTTPVALTNLIVDEADLVKVVLSMHPRANLLSVAIFDLTTDKRLYSNTFNYRADGILAPLVPATIAGGPILKQQNIVPGYQPVGDEFEVGELLPEGDFIPVRSFTREGSGTVSITSPVPVPGQYRLMLVWPPEKSNETSTEKQKRLELATVAQLKEKNRISFPLSQLPPGAVSLVVEYVQDANVQEVFNVPLMIGKVSFSTILKGIDKQQNFLTAALQTNVSGLLPGVYVELYAQFINFVWDAATLSYQEVPWGNEQQVLRQPVDTLTQVSPYSFSMPMPNQAGNWKVRFRVETTPQVTTSVTDTEQLFSNQSSEPDNWVAITDQAQSRIRVFDLAVKDWSSPDAQKWSWAPTTALGYSWGEISLWRLPSDVKLRNNGVWGGQWMVAATSGGLATIVAYPSGMRKWAASIGASSNPHSAELLPNGNIAVAASSGGWVRVYTSSQGANSSTYTEYRLPGAHGVLWDPKLDILWAVGDHELIGLKVSGPDNKPVLDKVIEGQLPSPWGHDLSPVYGYTDRLWVTTGSAVYQYIKSSNKFVSSYLGTEKINSAGVKSVGNQPSGQVVTARPKSGSLYEWSTDTINFNTPDESRIVKGAALYKARVWNPDYQ